VKIERRCPGVFTARSPTPRIGESSLPCAAAFRAVMPLCQASTVASSSGKRSSSPIMIIPWMKAQVTRA